MLVSILLLSAYQSEIFTDCRQLPMSPLIRNHEVNHETE